jgi:hypothetical protein
MPLFDDPPLHDFPDRAIRRLLETPANLRELLTAAVPDIAPHLDYERIEWQDRSFLMEDWRNRESDLLFRIPFRSPTAESPVLVCILLEHQSAPDPRMPLRVLIYAALYWEREWKAWEDRHDPGVPLRLTPILPIVFHTGAQPWNTNRSLAELIGGPEEFRPFAPQWQPLFWDLAEQDPHRLLTAAGAWLQALSVVRSERAERAEFEAVLAQVLPRLVELRQREEIRGHDLLWFVLSWALRRRPQEDREQLRTFLQTTIADETMREVIAVSNPLGQTYDEWWQQQVEERAAASAAESAARTELQTRREVLRDLLQDRFGTVPEEVLRLIEACDDPARLKAALRQVMRIQAPADLPL